jgi:hypothetical protein
MIKNLKSVFSAYGGWKSLKNSSYIRIAFILSLLGAGYVPEAEWTKLAQSIFPNLIGFSIAAIAIITVIGDDGFRTKMSNISTIKDGVSDMEALMASFMWFIFIQIVALLTSIIIDARSFDACWIFSTAYCDHVNLYANLVISSFGIILFFYGIVLVISSAFLTFDTFRLYTRSLK